MPTPPNTPRPRPCSSSRRVNRVNERAENTSRTSAAMTNRTTTHSAAANPLLLSGSNACCDTASALVVGKLSPQNAVAATSIRSALRRIASPGMLETCFIGAAVLGTADRPEHVFYRFQDFLHLGQKLAVERFFDPLQNVRHVRRIGCAGDSGGEVGILNAETNRQRCDVHTFALAVFHGFAAILAQERRRVMPGRQRLPGQEPLGER